jgi:hypothetical protein
MRAVHQAVRQIRHHVGTAYATARHHAQRLDQGFNLASRVFEAARPILKDNAPAYEQKAPRGAAQANESYDQMRGGRRGLALARKGACQEVGGHLEHARPLSRCLGKEGFDAHLHHFT